jgi:hypothetical protein
MRLILLALLGGFCFCHSRSGYVVGGLLVAVRATQASSVAVPQGCDGGAGNPMVVELFSAAGAFEP